MNQVLAMLVILAAVINLPKLGHLITLTESEEIVREAEDLARAPLSIGSDFADAYELALRRCQRAGIPCKSLLERRQEIADGFASCVDESVMCQSVQILYRSSNYSQVFANGKPTVKLPTHPYIGRLGNVLLDQFSAEKEHKLEVLLRWGSLWAAELVALSLFVIALLVFGIKKCLGRGHASRESSVVEVVAGSASSDAFSVPTLNSESDEAWNSVYRECLIDTQEAWVIVNDQNRRVSALLKRAHEENWSTDRYNLEYVAAGLPDERTAIGMTLVAAMREGFERW